MQPEGADAGPRYCGSCGEQFAAPAPACPSCGEPWSARRALDTFAVAAFLTELHGLYRGGLLSSEAYAGLRRVYERRLASIRPRRSARGTTTPLPPPAPASRLGAPAAPAAPSEPAGAGSIAAHTAARVPQPAGLPDLLRQPRAQRTGPTLAEWTAARQADLVLYIGAFLLSVAALIFVGYQGDTLSGPLRFVVLLAYTLGFLVLGIQLPRWERVREAGAVFLALGAALVPVNVLAVRTQVFRAGDMPDDVLLLAGSLAAAVLYLLLAARGYGRLYAAPGALAVVVAWVALGLILNLPGEWFGAWLAGGAGGALNGAEWRPRPLPGVRWVRRAALALLIGALLYAQAAAIIAETARWQLPGTHALTLLAALLALRLRRSVVALAVTPLLAALLAGSLGWAAADLRPEWFAVCLAAGAAGYLAVARYDVAARTPAWALTSAVAGLLTLWWVHQLVRMPDAQHAALPATYLLLLATALGWSRQAALWPSLAVIPPLAAGFVGSAVWSIAGLPAYWLGAVVALAAVGSAGISFLDPRRAPVWRGATVGWGGVALLIALLTAERGVAALPVTAVLLLAVSVWDGVHRRDAGAGFVPSLAALAGGAGAWAFAGMAPAWAGGWLAAAAIGYLALAETGTAPTRAWRLVALGGAAVAAVFAHVVAGRAAAPVAQLPVVYALLLAGALYDGRRRRDAGLLALPLVTAMFGVTLLHARGVGLLWWPYPVLATVAAMLAAEPWWRTRPVLRSAGWPYVLLPAVVLPLAWLGEHSAHPAHGLAVTLFTTLVLVEAALRAHGALVRVVLGGSRTGALFWEQRVLLQGAGAFAYGAAAHANRLFDLDGPERAWPYVVLSTAAWLALAARRGGPGLAVFGLPAITGSVLAAGTARADPGTLTAVLALAATVPIVAAAGARRWLPLLAALGFGIPLLPVAGWWLEVDRALAPPAYAVAGLVLWAALARRRGYSPDERGATVAALTWAPWVAAAVAVLVVVGGWTGDGPLVRSGVWQRATVAVALGGLAVTLEGVRLRRRRWWVAGTVALLLGAEMAIAIARPANVQAYTLPAGLYGVALGLSLRRGAALVGPHLLPHEAAQVMGMLVLTLPPAEQSFAPGGALFGIELIVMGLGLLGSGLLLEARWLVAGGVLALTGVAVRWLLVFGQAAPYWLTLGLAGSALLVIGLLLLSQRERWERWRSRAGRWWQGAGAAGSGEQRV